MQPTTEQEEVVGFLADPASHGGNPVERISTHSAHVFLAGDRAYKLKRAVRLPFLDFSTVERRKAALETELVLNRRTAPDLYLAVVPVCRRPSGALALGDGPAVDWVLVMRRFAQDALLDSMAVANTLSEPIIDRLADAVAAMHQSAEAIVAAPGTPFEVMALDNISALRNTELDQTAVDELESDLRAGMTGLAAHLRARAEHGFVRRLHGDLHLGNVAMVDGAPTPFDALEFDRDLATGDVYYDVAFLLMDLEHRGHRALANRLLNRYVLVTGDILGLRALPLFLAVRAAIRAKVLLLGAKPREADSYLTMATSYLPAKPARILAIGGLSGTGKSRLAIGLAPEEGDSPGAIVLRSDVVRKQLHGVADSTRLPADAYTAAVTERVYATLLDRARRVVEAGRSVIVDAVFAAPRERAALENLAGDLGVPFRGLWLEADLNVRLQRVGERAGDASDADAAVVKAQTAFDPGAISWLRCDASGSPAAVLARAWRLIAPSISEPRPPAR